MSTSVIAASAHLRIRPTMLSDLDFVVGVEQDARSTPFITAWERTQHEGAIRFPDSRPLYQARVDSRLEMLFSGHAA